MFQYGFLLIKWDVISAAICSRKPCTCSMISYIALTAYCTMRVIQVLTTSMEGPDPWWCSAFQ